jgi:signal transduction histidine kinase
VTNVFKQIITPPVFEDADQTRVARSLHAILLAFLPASLLIVAWQLMMYGRPTSHPEQFVILVGAVFSLTSIGLLHLLYHSHVKVAGALVSFILWGVTTWWSYGFGGVDRVTLASHSLVTITAGLTLGGRGALIASLICILSSLGYFHLQGIAPIPFDWVVSAVTLALTTLFLRSTARGTKAAIERTQDSERTLSEINRKLQREIQVRKRAETEREHLLERLRHRNIQLLTAAEVSKATSTILASDKLINQTVNLIREHFGFYYVGLFLVVDDDETSNEYAVLRAGTGEAGQEMLAANHRLEVGGPSMIGWCTAHGEARIALDVGEEKVRFDNPVLPKTRSEMALPLILRDQVIGALTVQSTQEAAFSEEDIAILQSVAEQLAIALENAKLYERLQGYTDELEQRVAERTAELTAVNKELEAFAYSVSHDLRAPLRSIDGFSRALLEDYPDKLDATGRDYLRRVRAASQRMGDLIDDLLKLSRVTRGEIHYEKVNLSELAQEIIEDLRRQAPDRSVTFSVEPHLMDEGDRRLLEAAMRNLLSNAWKFTRKKACARIEFGYTIAEGERAYFVRDNGAGFDMAYADKLFSAFQRLHRHTEFPGTGIGLATVQRIIHRHGGRVWAEGEVGAGATFYFTLPQR